MKTPRILLAGLLLWIAAGLAGPGFAQEPDGSEPVALVGDYQILEREFEETYRTILNLYRRQTGREEPAEGLAEFRRGVLEQLIRQKLMRAEAVRRGIEVTDAEAEKHLQGDPYFNPGGQFDLNLWAEFSSNPVSYEHAMKEARELLAGRRLLDQMYRRLTPSDDELRAFYMDHNERVLINALLIDHGWFRDDPDLGADAIRAHYDSLRSALGGTESVHLELFVVAFPEEVDDGSSSARGERRTRERADSVLAVLEEGASFEQLAETFGGIRDGGVWAKETETGIFYEDRELGDAALAAAEGEVLPRPLRVPGGYAIVRLRSKVEKVAPPLASVAGAVVSDYEQMRLMQEARNRAGDFHEAFPDSFLTVCTTWHAALVDTAEIEIEKPDRGDLEDWYEDNKRDFARLDPEGRGLVVPPFEELEEMARAGYVTDEKLRVAEEVAGKIAKAWKRGKRDEKQEKRARVWYELVSTPEKDAPPGVPPMLADTARTATVGAAEVLRGTRGFAVFAVAARDDRCPVPETEALRRAARFLLREREKERQRAARELYESDPERYLTAPTYHYTSIDIDIRPWAIVDLEDEEIEAHYNANRKDYGTPAEVRVRHLLIATPPGRDTSQALSRARELAEAARGGADFDSLARNFSDDASTREQGGDTGFLTEAGTPPGFESFTAAAFGADPGAILGPVRTAVGYHVIQVVERKGGSLQPLDIVWSNVSSSLARAKADSAAQRAATRAITGFENRADLLEWAEEQQFEALELSWRPGQRAIGPAAVPEVRQGLQERSKPGILPDYYFVAPRYVVIHLDSITPPQPATWEEAREQALADVAQARRMRAAKRAAEQMLAELNAGESWEAAAAPWGGGTVDLDVGAGFVVEGIGRVAEMDTLLFGDPDRRLTDGEAAAVTTEPGVMVIQIVRRHTVAPGEFAAVVDSLRSQELEYALHEYFEQLKERYPIRILREELDVELPPPPPLLSAVEARRE